MKGMSSGTADILARLERLEYEVTVANAKAARAFRLANATAEQLQPSKPNVQLGIMLNGVHVACPIVPGFPENIDLSNLPALKSGDELVITVTDVSQVMI